MQIPEARKTHFKAGNKILFCIQTVKRKGTQTGYSAIQEAVIQRTSGSVG